MQRGGAPTAFDRLLATRFAAAAVERLAEGGHGVLIGQEEGRIAATPLVEAGARSKPLDPRLVELARVLAR